MSHEKAGVEKRVERGVTVEMKAGTKERIAV